MAEEEWQEERKQKITKDDKHAERKMDNKH
jgi:hypothetical protein